MGKHGLWPLFKQARLSSYLWWSTGNWFSGSFFKYNECLNDSSTFWEVQLFVRWLKHWWQRNGLTQGCQTDPVKGHMAAGFHSNQARTHLIWIRCVLAWLEWKPAATWPFTGSVWHPWVNPLKYVSKHLWSLLISILYLKCNQCVSWWTMGFSKVLMLAANAAQKCWADVKWLVKK